MCVLNFLDAKDGERYVDFKQRRDLDYSREAIDSAAMILRRGM
jgi:hypothetical protein